MLAQTATCDYAGFHIERDVEKKVTDLELAVFIEELIVGLVGGLGLTLDRIQIDLRSLQLCTGEETSKNESPEELID